MIRAFLSHSSKDKDSYVRAVANWLGKDNIIYDEMTFEEGEKSLDEILSGLNRTEIFVLFLSDAALESDWVKKEIIEAKIKLDNGEISKIFPIIIDHDITYEDDRIPSWLTENYNLKPIRRARVAARRIHQKLRERSWSKHPQLEKRQNIFVGRNDKLEEFEERIHDFEQNKPIAIIASGMSGVGRRTFLHRALYKTNITGMSHKPSSIYLDRNVSIEDFILKLNDLGLIDLGNDILSLITKTIDEKREIIGKIMLEAYKSKELIYILDDGCLANYKREISPWFQELIDEFGKFDYPIFCCASRFNVAFQNRPRNSKFYFVELNELNHNERKRLFSQLLDLYSIHIERDDFVMIADLLFGLPDQVMYAVDLLKEDNISPVIKKLPLLQQYNADKASVIIQSYESNDDAMEFIRLLAQFEVITTDFLFSIVQEEKYLPILERIAAENICELIGIGGEVVRLNDVIRDYIKRNKLFIKNEFSKLIRNLVTDFIKEEEFFERDSSEYIFTIKELLREGHPVDEKYLIPSHYLRCMKDLYYNKGHLDRIISLADTILQKETTLEMGIIQDIRYYLCLALAKKRNKRLLKEVQKIHGDEHGFLLGFYYRQCGRLKDALDRLMPIAEARYVGARCKREIVQVYVQLEDYDKALTYAKRNYEENRSNQFHTQAYFNCLINSGERDRKQSRLRQLIQNLKDIDSEQSIEMAAIAEALFFAKVEHNRIKAFDAIDDCINIYPGNHYPLLTKCDISIKYRDIEFLSEAVNQLEGLGRRKHFSRRTLTKYKAYLLALKGEETNALKLLEKDLARFPEDSRNKVISRIKEFSEAARIH